MSADEEKRARMRRLRIDRCGECGGSGYARSPLGGFDPFDICAECGGSGVEGG